MSYRWLTASVALLTLFTPRHGRAQGSCRTNVREARTALSRSDRAASDAALRDGMVRALAGAFADDGVLLHAGAPVIRGRDQVNAFLVAQRELDSLQVQWQPLRVSVSVDCTMGVTFGDISVRRADQSAIRHGRYIAMWHRRDGAWRMAAFVATGVTQSLPAPAWVNGQEVSLGSVDPVAREFAEADLTFARRASESGAPTAFREFAASSGITFAGNGELLIGPENIGARMAENDDHAAWSWAPVHAAAAGSGDLGFTVGTATITRGEGASKVTSRSKYLTVWARQPERGLRFIVDGGNSLPDRRP